MSDAISDAAGPHRPSAGRRNVRARALAVPARGRGQGLRAVARDRASVARPHAVRRRRPPRGTLAPSALRPAARGVLRKIAGAWEVSDEMVVHPHLKRLCIPSSRYLEHIRAPGLEQLAIETYRTGEVRVLAFLSRSACALLRLSLFGCSTRVRWAELLPAVPWVMELTVIFAPDSVRVPSNFINSLLSDRSSTPLLPNLTALSVGAGTADRDVSLGLLRGIVRWAASVRELAPIRGLGVPLQFLGHIVQYSSDAGSAGSADGYMLEDLWDSGLEVRCLQYGHGYRSVQRSEVWAV
ncbi:hypothetical protein B0H10DRAFT_2026768 [Mycena sp. CBHHK59/15]|nr:hypothetical protein B0H10DRAFT_2026768 [Mycena sp. CBHHK59/15]